MPEKLYFKLKRGKQKYNDSDSNYSENSLLVQPVSLRIFQGDLSVPVSLLQDCDNLWWDAFTTEFFEDDAMLTITFCLEDGPKRYSKIRKQPLNIFSATD